MKRMFPSSSILPAFLSPSPTSSSINIPSPSSHLPSAPLDAFSSLFGTISSSSSSSTNHHLPHHLPLPPQSPDSFLQSALRALQLQLILEQQRQQLQLAIQCMLEPILQKEDAKGEGEQGGLAKREDAVGKEQTKSGQWTGGSSSGSSHRSSAEPNGKAEKRKRPNGKASNEGRKRRRRHEAETDSPVTGMFIKDSCDAEDLRKAAGQAELDDSAAFVHATEEARRGIGAIPDVIGECRCALCKIRFEDVFRLAMHKCPRIRHEEYRCRECEKVFSCPANLASHRRWHRPKPTKGKEKGGAGGGDCAGNVQERELLELAEEGRGDGRKGAPFGDQLVGLAEAANALITLGLVK